MTLIPLNSETTKLASVLPRIPRSWYTAYLTEAGGAMLGDSKALLKKLPDDCVDLIFTSPPFALRRKKSYGNEDAENYVRWFIGFAREFQRVLKPSGSLVVDIGGSWNPGEPTKSLYHYRLLIALIDRVGLHLAQEVFWYNDARLPSPAQWVCRDRVRLKDAVNMVWWLSKTPRPKANNRGVLTEYKPSQKKLMESKKYNQGRRPSEHEIGGKFIVDNGGAIPPNFLDQQVFDSLVPGIIQDGRGSKEVILPDVIDAPEPQMYENLIRAANTASSDAYLKGCKQISAQLHPARIPHALPEFFIRLLTEPGDLVLDPFAGSNVTGAVAEDLGRVWLAMEKDPNYLFASQTRFVSDPKMLIARCSRFETLARRTGTVFSYTPPQPEQAASGANVETSPVENGMSREGAEELGTGNV